MNSMTKSNGTVFFDSEKVYILKNKVEIPETSIGKEGRKAEDGLYVVDMKK